MVLVAKTQLQNAQHVKQQLNEVIDQRYYIDKDASHIYFPVNEKIRHRLITYMDRPMKGKLQPITLKQALSNKLTKHELEHLKTAFDTIGTIAIIEIDQVLEPKELRIAQTLLDNTPGIQTVVKKVGRHGGTFRTQKVKILAGKRTKEALYKENGITLKLHIEKVYFSPRLLTERKRIMEQVKPKETILVMFGGCAPYAVVLAKNTQATHITTVELNPDAHQYATYNIEYNKADNVTAIHGDVTEVVPTLGTFERILMPLPKSAEDYLDTALKAAKKGTVIHFYDFLEETQFKQANHKIKEACQRNNMSCTILDTVKCGQHAPHTFRICVDFKIN